MREQHEEQSAQIAELRRRELNVVAEHDAAIGQFNADISTLKREHEEVLRGKQAEVDTLLQQLSAEQDATVADLQRQLEDASDALAASQKVHEEAFGKLKAEYDDELRKQREEVDAALAKASEEHEATLLSLKASHETELSTKEQAHAGVLQRTEEEYYVALSNLRSSHSDILAKKEAEFSSSMERLKEEHAGALKMADLAREGSLTESHSHQAELINQLQAEHSSAIEKKEAQLADDLRKVQEDHASVLAKRLEDHTAAMERLKAKHSSKLSELEESKDREADALKQTLQSAVQQHGEAIAALRTEHDAALHSAQEQHKSFVDELKSAHEQVLSDLKAEHASALEKAESAAREALEPLLQEKTEEVVRLKHGHQEVLGELEASKVAAQERHLQDLESARLRNKSMLDEERERLEKSLADLQATQGQEMETLRKDNALLHEELASYKASHEEFLAAQELARQVHDRDLQERDTLILDLRQGHDTSQSEKADLAAELERVRSELEQALAEKSHFARDAADKATLEDQVSQQRAAMDELHGELQKTKEHRDGLLSERTKQETIVRDLQVQLSRAINLSDAIPTRPSDRNSSFSRTNGSKLPPLTPPPSVPPPPAPRSIPPVPMDVAHSVSSQSSTLRSSGSSRESNPDSPSTSVAGSAPNPSSPMDSKLNAQLEDQARHVEEQEVMIKTLNKQLSHCESDLQAHMDLVSTLETSLGDSEKNRKC